MSRTLLALRGALALAGAGVIGFGLYGLLHDPYVQHPFDVLTWAVGAVIVHDGLWVPLLCLLAVALPRLPWTVRGGLVVAAAVTAVALPAVLRQGQGHGNPTVLALPYLRNWLLTLAAIAVVTLLATVLRRRRRRPAGKR
ncbi:hypothetical protein GCM10009665_70360 [Kitasatospora nipponensis]|uniref:Uncharacterized protein n=1 Tax=Kitasatospora nipponensis TaxID=258049 RepID=A0ABN1X0D7_9ACTN